MINILLAEDDEADILLFKEVMEQAFFENTLHIVHSGDEALEFLRANKGKADFIITDINMPRMNGHEFLAAIGQDAELKKLPVIVLTGSDDRDDYDKSHDLNAIAHFTKPLNQSKVTEIVRQVERFWSKK